MVNTALLLHYLSFFLFCLEVTFLPLSRIVSKHKKTMKNKVTSNFIILYKRSKASEESLVCAGYSQIIFSVSLKWTLIQYGSARLSVSCQSPCYATEITMSTVQNSQKFLCEGTNISFLMHVSVYQ